MLVIQVTMIKSAVFISLIILSNTQLSLSFICVVQKSQQTRKLMYKFSPIKIAQTQKYGDIYKLSLKSLYSTQSGNIALYIIKPASSLCSDLTFDIKDEVTAVQKWAHTTASVCQLTGHWPLSENLKKTPGETSEVHSLNLPAGL